MRNELTTKLALSLTLFLSAFPTVLAQTNDPKSDDDASVKIGPLRIHTRETYNRDAVAVGHNVTVKEGETSHDIVVVFGDASIDGEVTGDLVVVLGNAKLGPKAAVKGDAVVVGGKLEKHPDATIEGERTELPLHIFGFEADRPWLAGLKHWGASGLLLGRPLVPQYAWTWAVAGVFLILYILVALLFPRSLNACVGTLEAKPVTSFFIGVLSLLLLCPLLVLLTATVVGLVIVPFLLCAAVAAHFLGRATVYRYAGQQIGKQTGVESLQKPLIALIVGTAIFCLLYTIPFLGFLVWGAIVPLGFGAAVLAFFQSFRSEAARAPAVAAIAAPAATVAAPGDLPPASPGLTPPLMRPRVGFWLRTFTTLLDLVLIGILVRVFSGRHGPTPQIFILLWLVYHVGMWTWKGATIGDMALGIKIVRVDGQPINFGVALVRSLASFFSFLVLGLGFFWAGWTQEKQSWHDKIAGTIVVKLPKGVPAI